MKKGKIIKRFISIFLIITLAFTNNIYASERKNVYKKFEAEGDKFEAYYRLIEPLIKDNGNNIAYKMAAGKLVTFVPKDSLSTCYKGTVGNLVKETNANGYSVTYEYGLNNGEISLKKILFR